MKKMIVTLTAAACALFVTTTFGSAGGAKKVEPKCPVSGKAIDKDASVEHNGGKVYFCCMNCPKAFEKDTAKFAAKANYQLLVTGQAKQVKCAFTGGKLNPETKIEVGGVPVCFCCFNCQGKVKEEPTAKQVEAIFNDKAFKKGYEVKKGS